MAKCFVCEKGLVTGNNVSHANNKTKRRMLPNLQKTRIVTAGGTMRKQVCTRCLRSGRAKKAV